MANAQQLTMLKNDLPHWNITRTPPSLNSGYKLEEIDLREADLRGSKLVEAELCNANLSKANLSGTNLSRANLSGANLSGANFNGARLIDANLQSANLDGANLSDAILLGANLSGANLLEANLGEANLSKADLFEANLLGANLREANLSETKLIRTSLTEANISKATLRGANLLAASLDYANLNDADLRGANLWSSDLTGASLIRTNLTESNFLYARVGNTIFGNLDLINVKRLNDVIHIAPSIFGIGTIVKSKGKIPRSFLQGCGLSDLEIEIVRLYDPDLNNKDRDKSLQRINELTVHQVIQNSPIFISYSHADSIFVDKLESQLNMKGIRYWRDIHELKAGKLEKQIDRAISQNSTVLLVLSKYSFSSDWVKHEVIKAKGLEKERGFDILCPLALDDSWKSSPWPEQIMEQIREYNILDFSEWEDDVKFEGMFRRLIDGLELFYEG